MVETIPKMTMPVIDAARVGDVSEAIDGDDEHIRSPSPKRRWTNRGEPTRKRKKTV